MARLELAATIDSTPERVFDLARSIDLHAESMTSHGEVAAAGVTTGLIGRGQSVTFKARHFLVTFSFTSRITIYDRPRHFRDCMVAGPFCSVTHDHFFEPHGQGTIMRDVFDYALPLFAVGLVADRLFLRRHMKRLLEKRAEAVKRVAESSEWQSYLREA